jgi:hypothetical protein
VSGPAQHFLHHGVLGGIPVNGAAHAPEVDDVADQEQMLGRVFPQEVQQTFRLACAGAQVNIRNEDRPYFWHGTALCQSNVTVQLQLGPMNKRQAPVAEMQLEQGELTGQW